MPSSPAWVNELFAQSLEIRSRIYSILILNSISLDKREVSHELLTVVQSMCKAPPHRSHIYFTYYFCLPLIANVYSDKRGITFLLSSIIFHIVPTALEISMVCGILVCGLRFDFLIFFLIYWFSFSHTDLQVWSEFCLYHFIDNGWIYMVHDPYNCMEVSMRHYFDI